MLNIIKKFPFYSKLRSLYLSTLNDEQYFKWVHKRAFHTSPDFKNPQTFNEKIVHRILYDRNPIYTLLADKIKARIYIAYKLLDPNDSKNQEFFNLCQVKDHDIFEQSSPIWKEINSIQPLIHATNLCEYLPKIYGVWDHPSEIDFSNLPQSFVLKTNHDGGGVVIVKNKDSFLNDQNTFKQAIKKLTKHLQTNWYPLYREYHYKDIEPKVFAEELLTKENDNSPDDYKFHTFQDEYFSETIIDRGIDTKCTFFDRQWNPIDVEITFDKANKEIPKPENLDFLLQICKNFYQDIGYVRVDFYILNNSKVYIGELTLTPGGGRLPIRPRIWDKKLGEYWK